MLGAADADLLFGAVDAVAAGDARSALLAAARLAESGRDIGRFFGDLEAHARALMVVQTLGGEVPPELQVTAEQDERLREQAARVGQTDVVRMLDLIAVGLRAMKDGSDARTQLELALVKAAVPKVDASAKALQSRLERLEAGRPAPRRPSPGREGRRRPRHRRRPRRAGERRGRSRRPRPPPRRPGRRRAPRRRSAAPSRRRAARPPLRPPPRRATDRPPPAAAPAASGRRARSAAAPPLRRAPSRSPEPSVAAVAVVEPPGEEPIVAAVGLDLDAFAELWPAVIESIQEERPLLAEHLRSRARPRSATASSRSPGPRPPACPSARRRTPPTAS